MLHRTLIAVARCALLSAALFASCSEARGQQRDAWFTKVEVPHDTVAAELTSVWQASPEAAAAQARSLTELLPAASPDGKRAIELLIAVARERAGDVANARAAYDALCSQAPDTPYAASADYRLRVLGQSEPAALEAIYSKVLQHSALTRNEAWHLVSDRWIWTTPDRAANQALVDLRQSQLSFRFFNLLREQSFFPPPYAYLFILLALTLGIKVLSLPLLIRSAKLAVVMRRLAPEVRAIQQAYADDLVTMQKQLQALYQARGVNVFAGCPAAIVDLIFVIWAVVSLSTYAPRMALDNARFLWIGDVTTYHFSIVLLWLGLCYFHSWVSGARGQSAQGVSQLAASVLAVGGLVWLIAWYWQCPAYVFIFWMLLMVSGLLITRTLVPILELRKR